MKKVKILSAWIITMIVCSVTPGFAINGNTNNETAAPWNRISYKIVIHINSYVSLCDVYMVELLDASGKEIAPTQTFQEGKAEYYFTEATRQIRGIRSVRLVMIQSGQPYNCPAKLYTQPKTRVLSFENGSSYQFDLYPEIWSNKYSTE
jgi:hypothetical protein